MDLNHDSNKRLHLHVVTVCLFSDVSGLEVGDPVWKDCTLATRDNQAIKLVQMN